MGHFLSSVAGASPSVCEVKVRLFSERHPFPADFRRTPLRERSLLISQKRLFPQKIDPLLRTQRFSLVVLQTGLLYLRREQPFPGRGAGVSLRVPVLSFATELPLYENSFFSALLTLSGGDSSFR